MPLLLPLLLLILLLRRCARSCACRCKVGRMHVCMPSHAGSQRVLWG
jgi:hypothetical protein